MTKLEQFISKASVRFPNRFDYSKVMYTTSEAKVTITCSVHGEIQVAPYTFLRSKQGCQKCSRENMSNKWTTAKFIRKSKAKFGNRFTYDKTVYNGSKVPVDITCPLHGTFTQKPEKHLQSKHGCPKCANNVTTAKLTEDTSAFVRKAYKLHGDKFDYTDTYYTGYKTNVAIKCNTCNTSFNQTPNSHMNGSGCPVCSTSGFNEAAPAILYYLSINNGQAYKIGITNRTVCERYNLTDLKSITVLSTIAYKSGAACREKERAILKEYAEYKYTGTPLLASGNTELFSVDVLNAATRSTNEIQST